MGTIFEKVDYLSSTKEAIKQVINNNDVTVTDNATFREYANLIKDIPMYDADNGVRINIKYGDTEPSNKTCLWIKSNTHGKVHVKYNSGTETSIPNVGELQYDTECANDTIASVGNNIYIFGGVSTDRWLSEIQCFDTTTNTTTVVGNLAEPVNGCAVASVGTKIYIFGGYGDTSQDRLGTVQCFDTTDNSIQTLDVSITEREFFCASAVGTKIYLFGGLAANTTYPSVIECFDTETNTVSVLDSTLSCGYWCSSVVIENDIYIFGGNNGSYDTHIYKFDTTTNTLTTTPWSIYAANARCAAAVGNQIYICGGWNDSSLSTAIRLNILTGTQTPLDILPNGIYSCSAAFVNNKVYIVGGYNNGTRQKAIHCFDTQPNLDSGDILIKTSSSGSEFNIISTYNLTCSVKVKGVYIGNESNYAESVDALLYKNGAWTYV